MKDVTPYDPITPESVAREIERLREKASHDEAQALYHAKQVGWQKGWQEGWREGIQEAIQEGISQRSVEIAANLLKIGMPPVQVAAVTGLTLEEVEQL